MPAKESSTARRVKPPLVAARLTVGLLVLLGLLRHDAGSVQLLGGDPWRDAYRHGGNGDGTLFYPGTPDRRPLALVVATATCSSITFSL